MADRPPACAGWVTSSSTTRPITGSAGWSMALPRELTEQASRVHPNLGACSTDACRQSVHRWPTSPHHDTECLHPQSVISVCLTGAPQEQKSMTSNRWEFPLVLVVSAVAFLSVWHFLAHFLG
jgi:hypothetical protein